jgi:predicted DNA-binding transcriptional regulator AlpA
MELLTVAEVAKMLKVSQRQVRELANPRFRSGDTRTNPLPAMRLSVRVIRFRKSDVEAWIEKLARGN